MHLVCRLHVMCLRYITRAAASPCMHLTFVDAHDAPTTRVFMRHDSVAVHSLMECAGVQAHTHQSVCSSMVWQPSPSVTPLQGSLDPTQAPNHRPGATSSRCIVLLFHH